MVLRLTCVPEENHAKKEKKEDLFKEKYKGEVPLGSKKGDQTMSKCPTLL